MNKGRGYVEAELHPADRSLPVDLVRIDAIYNPVRRANFTVAETRVGQRTDYDRLTVTVETNGTITPGRRDRLRGGAGAGALPVLRGLRQGAHHARRRAPTAGAGGGANLRQRLEPADRRLRALGPLAQLAQELEHPDPQGSGRVQRGRPAQGQERRREGAQEIAELLQREGLNFGMGFEETDGELRVLASGRAADGRSRRPARGESA